VAGWAANRKQRSKKLAAADSDASLLPSLLLLLPAGVSAVSRKGDPVRIAASCSLHLPEADEHVRYRCICNARARQLRGGEGNKRLLYELDPLFSTPRTPPRQPGHHHYHQGPSVLPVPCFPLTRAPPLKQAKRHKTRFACFRGGARVSGKQGTGRTLGP
jgi:hypothetical protein